MLRGVRAKRTAAGLFAVVGLVASSGASRAGPQPTAVGRKILLIDDREDPTYARVTAELRALGFEVEISQDTPATFSDSEMALLSRSAHAVATVAVDRRSAEVRVWTVDRATGGIVLRAVVAIDQDSAVVALRTVEAVRTSLNDVDSGAPVKAPEAFAPTAPVVDRAVTAVASPEPPSLGVSLGLALAGSPGNPGTSWQGLLSAAWLLGPRWGIEAAGVAPMTHAGWGDREGSASLTFGLVAVGAHWRPFATRCCLLDLGTDVGAALVHTEGSPNAGFTGERHDTWVATPLVRVGYAVSVATSVWLRADAIGALAIPRPVFAFADRTVGTWGQPLVLGSLGIEVGLR